MALTLGQDEIFLSRKTRLTSEASPETEQRRRRRTVSTSFEQSRGKGSFVRPIDGSAFHDTRKTQSFSRDIPLVAKNLLRKESTLSSFPEVEEQEDLAIDDTPSAVSRCTWLKQLPGFSIILNIFGVIIFQLGNVVVKTVQMEILQLLLMRDLLVLSQTVPFTIYCSEGLPRTKGQKFLLVFNGLISTLNSLAHYHAVTVLPLGDVMMISAVKPIFITFFSCIFLKEKCGIFEILNILLVMAGIVLVVQPPFLFGYDDQEYSAEMLKAAMILMGSNAMVSLTAIISRHLRDTHWSIVCLSSKAIGCILYLSITVYNSSFCLPDCGLLRFKIIVISLVANVTMVFYVICLQNEEAHIIGLSDNASNIIVSQLFGILFFSQIPKTLKLLGFFLVLLSMLMIGLKKILDNRKLSAECDAPKK